MLATSLVSRITTNFKIEIYFLIYLLIYQAYNIPYAHNFDFFAIYDCGTNFVVQDLMRKGLVPSVDFGYQYGLLTLLFGKLWFSLFGPSPLSYSGSILFLNSISVLAIVRLLKFSGASKLVAIFTLVMMEFYINVIPSNFCHILESTLVVLAITSHFEGKRGQALALLTLGLFIKPAMAYFYGILLLTYILAFSLSRVRDFVPAIFAFVGASILSLAFFGWGPFVVGFNPTKTSLNYEINSFGFFNEKGNYFWSPAGKNLNYYLGTSAGFWILLTLGLSAYTLWKLTRERNFLKNSFGEVIFACLFMHLSFIFLFYGGTSSWRYYAFIPLVGSVLALTHERVGPKLLIPLIFIGLLSQYATVKESYKRWSFPRTKETLFVPPEVLSEWNIVLESTMGRAPAFMGEMGALEYFSEVFQPSETFHFLRGIAIEPDIRRMRERLKKSKVIVTFKREPLSFYKKNWPELADVLEPYRLIWQGEHFEIFEK